VPLSWGAVGRVIGFTPRAPGGEFWLRRFVGRRVPLDGRTIDGLGGGASNAGMRYTRPPKHLPDAEEIRERCLAIQETWDRELERTRGAWAYELAEVEFPQAKAAVFVKIVDSPADV